MGFILFQNILGINILKGVVEILSRFINGDIKVKYLESLKNVIFLIGPSSMSLYVNDTYKEMGAYVAIPSTGLVKLSDSNISSNLNTSATGSYEVTYSYDNADSVKRIVEIIN